MEEKENKPIGTQVKEETEQLICEIVNKGITEENIEYLSELVDVHKDIANEEYWKAKKEDLKMRYRSYGRDSYSEGTMGKYEDNRYGNYGRRERDSRGRYMARGYDAKYRGEDALEGMYQGYREYSEGRSYGRDSYGAKEETMKSLEYMLESTVDFIEMLKHEAGSQEELEMIKKYTRKISEM